MNTDRFSSYESDDGMAQYPEYQRVFNEGVQARIDERPLKSCPYDDRRGRYWAMGWADRDMIISHEQTQ